MYEEPTFPCGNCGSGNLESRLGGDRDRHRVRTDWVIDYKNVPGWYCNDCQIWFPDHTCVDERGEPTVRRENHGPRSQKEIILEEYYKQKTQQIVSGFCFTCDDMGITRLYPLTVCRNCGGRPNSIGPLGRFLVGNLVRALNEARKGKVRQPPPPATKVKYVNDPRSYYYGVLGLKEGASKKEIQKAYHKMSKAFHPDNSDTGDPERFLLLNEAKRRLLGNE